MKIVCVLIGLFLCLSEVLGGVTDPHYVSIDQSDMKVKPGSDVTLNCVGWNGALAYYIQNRVVWSFTDKDGKSSNLSSGFYMDPQDPYAKMLQNTGRLEFKYSSDEEKPGNPHNFKLMLKMKWSFKNKDGMVIGLTNGFEPELEASPLFDKFKYSIEVHSITSSGSITHVLIVRDIQFSDDGIYNCSLGDSDRNIISSEAVNITVVSPVKKLRIELYEGKDIVASSESFTEGDMAVKVVPGDYSVKCTAQGSNPEPKMSLLVNDALTYVATTHERKIDGDGPTYNSHYVVDQVTLEPKATDQLLMCEGNIVGDFYREKKAGIKLRVQIDKPHFMCDNLTTNVGERYRKISCELHTKDGGQPPLCKHVFWKFGDSGKVREMGNTEKWTDPNKEYNIMESECTPDAHGVKVSLMMYTVEPIHMSTTFYVVYGVGSDAEQMPIDIILKEIDNVETNTATNNDESNGANMLTPVTVLSSLLTFLIGRLIARNL